MTTPSGDEGYVGFAVQAAKETAASAFYGILHTSFSWEPQIVQDEEPEAEIGATGIDVAKPERFGHEGATFRGELRMRPGNAGFILRAFGMTATEGPFVIIPTVNDVIRVTDDGGGPVDVNIVTGTGASLEYLTAYTGAEIASGLEDALDGDTTLSETYTCSFTSNKFTIGHAGSTLSLHWTSEPLTAKWLGYDYAADDTGSTSYQADNDSNWPNHHVFAPIDAVADFEWMTILDKFNDNADLDTLLIDARVNSVTFTADANGLVRMSYEGIALSFEDAAGSETSTADASTIGTPNTGNDDGYVIMNQVAYWAASFETTLQWEQTTLPRLAQMGPEEITASRRRIGGTMDIYFGADDGVMWRKAYYGGASGTTFSTDIVQEPLAVQFCAGQDTPTGTDAPLPYSVIFSMYHTNILTYPLEKAGGDPVDAGMTFMVSRDSIDWGIVFVNGYAANYYD